MPINFKYVPLEPEPLSGKQFIEQTEKAFNELGAEIDDISSSSAEALETANRAFNTAETAIATANTALTNANTALTTANNANTAAQAAATTANTAFDKAAIAESTASAAATDAQTALTTANAAQSSANSASQAANTALVIAQDALNTASVATIALVAMSDIEPTDAFTDGDKYYNTTDKQIYFYYNDAWGDQENPIAGAIYEYAMGLFMWDGADLVSVGGGGTGSSHPALSMLIMPCALTGGDALGWTIQGGVVTETLSPDLYTRIAKEYNDNVDFVDSFVWNNAGGVDQIANITCRRSASSGLKIVDISNRSYVDNLYNTTGSAFYIILDQVNKLFHLPRFNDGITFTGDINQLGVYGKDQIVNLVGSASLDSGYGLINNNPALTGILKKGTVRATGSAGASATSSWDLAVDSSLTVNTGDRVQGRNIKVFVYFRTGDNVINGQDIDFGGVWAELNNINARPHIVDTWRSADGLSWYRKYSDGWIEQGGHVTAATTGVYTFNLPIPFSNVNYTILLTSTAIGLSHTPVVNAATVSTISAVLLMGAQTSPFKSYWRASGF